MTYSKNRVHACRQACSDPANRAACLFAWKCEARPGNRVVDNKPPYTGKPGLCRPGVVMERLRTGEPLRKALHRVGTYEGFRSHCKLHEAWGIEAKALVEQNAEAGEKRRLKNFEKFTRRKNWTHCARGHKFTAENTRKIPGGRACRTCERMHANHTGPLMKPDVLAKVKEALRRKLRFVEIIKLVDKNTFYRQKRRDPEFAALCAEWRKGSRERYGRRQQKRNGAKRYNWIVGLLPKSFPEAGRPEIVSNVYEAVKGRYYSRRKDLRGAFGWKYVPECISLFVRDYWKLHPTKAFGDIRTPWSLDAPVSYENDTRLIDTVSEGLWTQ